MVFHKAGAKENSRSNLEKETQKPTGVKAPKENHLLPQKGKKTLIQQLTKEISIRLDIASFFFSNPFDIIILGYF